MTKSEVQGDLTNIMDEVLPSSGSINDNQISEFANKVIEYIHSCTKTVNPDIKPVPSIKF